MKTLAALERALLWVERTTVVVILTVMIGLAFLQVILRNVLSVGFLWADPLLRHAVLWIGFIGASIAARQEKHINIDMVTRFLPPRVTNLVRILTNLFAAAVSLGMAEAGRVFLVSEREVGDVLVTIGQTELPAWYFQTIIPVGFALISFRFILKALSHVVDAFRPAAPSEQNLHVPTPEVR